jgi:P2-related tail formation protein
VSNDIYTDLFVDNLPESINWDSQVQAIGMASDTQATGLQPYLPQLLVLCNIPNLPESTLDLLAFQYSVLFWNQLNLITDPVQRLATKQKYMANNFYYHAHLGTPQTTQDIVSSVYGPAIVQEWFLYGGQPNHFRILLPAVVDSATEAQMLSLVTIVKRASQAMDGFYLFTSAPTRFYVAVGVVTECWLFLPMPKQSIGVQYLSIGLSIVADSTVQRSSAVLQIATGMSVIAGGRQLSVGAMVCDIHTKMSTNIIAKAIHFAATQIYMGGAVISLSPAI